MVCALTQKTSQYKLFTKNNSADMITSLNYY